MAVVASPPVRRSNRVSFDRRVKRPTSEADNDILMLLFYFRQNLRAGEGIVQGGPQRADAVLGADAKYVPFRTSEGLW